MFITIHKITGKVESTHKSMSAAVKKAEIEGDFPVDTDATADESGLDAISTKLLTQVHNHLVDDDATIKRFAKKIDGVRRVLAALQDFKPAKGRDQKQAGNARGSSEDILRRTLHLLAVESKKWKTGSMRSLCFGLIKDGMTVAQYLKATEKKSLTRTQALGQLHKLQQVSSTSVRVVEMRNA